MTIHGIDNLRLKNFVICIGICKDRIKYTLACKYSFTSSITVFCAVANTLIYYTNLQVKVISLLPNRIISCGILTTSTVCCKYRMQYVTLKRLEKAIHDVQFN